MNYFQDNAVSWYLHVLPERPNTRNGGLFLINGTMMSRICGSAYIQSSYAGEESAELIYSNLGKDSEIIYGWKSTFSEPYYAQVFPKEATLGNYENLPCDLCFGVAPFALRIDKTAWHKYIYSADKSGRHSASNAGTLAHGANQSSLLSPRMRLILRSCMCGFFVFVCMLKSFIQYLQ